MVDGNGLGRKGCESNQTGALTKSVDGFQDMKQYVNNSATHSTWKGVRVVDGNGLENRRAGNGTVGSNPTLSATY